MVNPRKAQRVRIAKIANISIDGIQETTKVIVRDLSTTGMGCITDRVFNKGDTLQVEIELNTSTGKVIKESLTGIVARVTKHETEKKHTFGMEFRDMEKRYPRIYAYIKRLEDS